MLYKNILSVNHNRYSKRPYFRLKVISTELTLLFRFIEVTKSLFVKVHFITYTLEVQSFMSKHFRPSVEKGLCSNWQWLSNYSVLTSFSNITILRFSWSVPLEFPQSMKFMLCDINCICTFLEVYITWFSRWQFDSTVGWPSIWTKNF